METWERNLIAGNIKSYLSSVELHIEDFENGSNQEKEYVMDKLLQLLSYINKEM